MTNTATFKIFIPGMDRSYANKTSYISSAKDNSDVIGEITYEYKILSDTNKEKPISITIYD